MTADGLIDAPWEDAPSPHGDTARRFVIGPYDATFAVPRTGGLRRGIEAAVTGPAGTATAWIAGEPSSLAMQLGGVEARAGDRTVLLKRNRPALRRRHRTVTITGPGIDWRLRTAGRAAVITDVAGRVLWRATPDGQQLRPDLAPDETALVLLLVYAQVPQSISSWGALRFL